MIPNFSVASLNSNDQLTQEGTFLGLPKAHRHSTKNAKLMKRDTIEEIQQDYDFKKVVAYIPENASEKERNIHRFLDSFHIYTVNVKDLIEDFSKTPTSNKLRQEF